MVWGSTALTAPPRITRFAPSPTGELHLGHVAHALHLRETAESLGARVIVRMEDHDRTRCRTAYELSILEDIAWLGFRFDEASIRSLLSHPSPYRQSDHPERYEAALEQLRRVARVYPCRCTRSMMAPPDADGERRHDDACRHASDVPEQGSALRVELPDLGVEWEDLDEGTQREHPWRRVGDTLLRDALGQWSYQFCVVVDDLHDGVDLIVRGEDLRASTGRQVLLAEMLGRTAPVAYRHHPLLLAPDGRKLSKRDVSETVRSMRDRGMSPDDVLRRARAEA